MHSEVFKQFTPTNTILAYEYIVKRNLSINSPYSGGSINSCNYIRDLFGYPRLTVPSKPQKYIETRQYKEKLEHIRKLKPSIYKCFNIINNKIIFDSSNYCKPCYTRIKCKPLYIDFKVDTYRDYLTSSEKCKVPEKREMSFRTKSKIRNKVNALFHAFKDDSLRFGFFTITLPCVQSKPDYYYTKILNTVLTRLRKKYEFNYLWVAEHQNNGNIHYHIIMSGFIDVQEFNYMWCKALQNKGIVLLLPCPVRKKKGSIYTYDSKGCANPVDYQPINDLNGVGNYMTKYVTKNKSEIHGQSWHSSRFVSRLQTKMTNYFDESTLKDIENKQYYENKEGITVESNFNSVQIVTSTGVQNIEYLKVLNKPLQHDLMTKVSILNKHLYAKFLEQKYKVTFSHKEQQYIVNSQLFTYKFSSSKPLPIPETKFIQYYEQIFELHKINKNELSNKLH